MHESPYAASHKGLRNALGRFQLLAGSTDYGDRDALAALKAKGAELELLLTHHLVNEDRFFLAPLLTRDEGVARHDLDDHQRLEALQGRMLSALARLDGSQSAEEHHAFYLLVTEFHSSYLAHILHEERVTEPALFSRFTEEEVAGFSAELVKVVEQPVLVASLKYILPALPPAERRALLARLEGAPFYQQLLAEVGAEGE